MGPVRATVRQMEAGGGRSGRHLQKIYVGGTALIWGASEERHVHLDNIDGGSLPGPLETSIFFDFLATKF